MSTENLKVVITGDASGLDKTSAGAQKALENISGTAQQMQKRLDDLIAKEQSLLRATNNTFNPELLAKYNKALADVRNQMNPIAAKLDQLQANTNKVVPSATHATNGFYGLSRSASQANFAMVSLAQGIGDLPYGFSAIANNIQQTIQGFTYLQRTTGGAGKALKALGATLTGPTGLFIGFSVVTSIITGLVSKYGSLSNAATALFGHLTDQEKAQKNLNDAIKDSSKTIQSNIEGLLKVKSTVDLAAGGYVSAKTAVSQFNKELGSAFGDVNSLAQAQDKLNASSQAYIQATIYRTVATKLFSKAAKEVTDNIELQAKSNSDAATGIEKTINFLKAGFNFKNTSWDAVFKQMDQLNDKSGAAQKRLSQLTTQNDFGKLTEQAQGFLQTAAKIAKQFNLNIFGDDGNGSGKGLKTISDLLSEIQTKFKSVDTLAAGLGQSQEQIATEKIKILYDYIQKIADIGGPGAVKAIKDIVNQANQIDTDAFLPILSGGRAQVNAPSGIGNINVPTTVQGQPGNLGTSKDTIKLLNEQFRDTVKTGRELESVFEGIFSSIAQGENPFQALIQTIEQLIIKLAAAAAAAAVLSLIPGAGGFLSIFGSLSRLPFGGSHAAGGFIPGPQLAIVGDAPGGEWVLNQSQMRAIMQGGGGNGTTHITGEFRIAGNDLKAVLSNQNIIVSRRNG